jgi:hypothetical protein
MQMLIVLVIVDGLVAMWVGAASSPTYLVNSSLRTTVSTKGRK